MPISSSSMRTVYQGTPETDRRKLLRLSLSPVFIVGANPTENWQFYARLYSETGIRTTILEKIRSVSRGNGADHPHHLRYRSNIMDTNNGGAVSDAPCHGRGGPKNPLGWVRLAGDLPDK